MQKHKDPRKRACMPAYNSPLDSGRPQRNPALDTDALQGLEDLDGPTDGVGDLTVTLKQARAGKTQQDTDALCTHPLFIVFFIFAWQFLFCHGVTATGQGANRE